MNARVIRFFLFSASVGLVVGLFLGFRLAGGQASQLLKFVLGGEPQTLEESLQEAHLIQEIADPGEPPPQDSARAGSSSPVLPLSFRSIAERSFPSVVFVVLQYPNRKVSEASGFVVERGIVATNFHVIDGAIGGEVNLVGHKNKLPIQGVVAVDALRDIALLAVPALEAPPLELGENDRVAVGDKIFVVGNPNGLEGTFSDGIVSGRRDFKDFDLLQITAPISSGSSGGPVLDVRGSVIGVAKGSWESGQNLNFAIPSAFVKQLLQSKGEPQQLTKVTHPKFPKRTAEAGGAGLFAGFWRIFRR